MSRFLYDGRAASAPDARAACPTAVIELTPGPRYRLRQSTRCRPKASAPHRSARTLHGSSCNDNVCHVVRSRRVVRQSVVPRLGNRQTRMNRASIGRQSITNSRTGSHQHWHRRAGSPGCRAPREWPCSPPMLLAVPHVRSMDVRSRIDVGRERENGFDRECRPARAVAYCVASAGKCQQLVDERLGARPPKSVVVRTQPARSGPARPRTAVRTCSTRAWMLAMSGPARARGADQFGEHVPIAARISLQRLNFRKHRSDAGDSDSIEHGAIDEVRRRFDHGIWPEAPRWLRTTGRSVSADARESRASGGKSS